MTDPFSSLLAELSTALGIPLEPDQYSACSIEIKPLTVQLQLDSAGENLFIFTEVIEVPPGKFRENVLCEALKVNASAQPKAGIFGYVAKTSHLALYQSYPIGILTGDRLSGFFGAFFEMAQKWHESIQSGRSSPGPSGNEPPLPGLPI